MLKETFLVVPTVNGSELLRSLARRNRNTFLLRIVSPVELARLALMRRGAAIEGTFLFGTDETAVMANAIEGIPYFSGSYADAEAVAEAVKSLCFLIPGEERETIQEKLLPGSFERKNAALFAAWKIEALKGTLAPESELLPLLLATEQVFAEIEKGYRHVIGKYSLIRGNLGHWGKIDRSAVKVIGDAIDSYMKYGSGDVSRIIPSLLRKTVSSENSREGYLHITSIDAARYTLRESLFIAGLSARYFPGEDVSFGGVSGVEESKVLNLISVYSFLNRSNGGYENGRNHVEQNVCWELFG